MIKLKQVEPFTITSGTTAVTDGQALDGTETAALSAGVDENQEAQFLAVETDGRVKISDGGQELTVNGSIVVENFPPIQAVDGAVAVTNFPAIQAVSGSVVVSNLPPTQAVSGSVAVTNFPPTQAVSGSVSVTGTVGVTDAGGSLTVDGSVSVTNLGHAEDAASVSGDTGVAMLAVYQPDTFGVSADTVGDYATLKVDDKGRLRVSAGGVVNLDPFNSSDGFTGVDTDAGNITFTTNHVRGIGAVSFDKLDTPANSLFGLIQKTIAPVDLSNLALGVTFLQVLIFLPSLTNVKNVIIRLGTDALNYNSWTLPVTEAVPGIWQVFRTSIGNSNASVGNGWNLAAVSYFAVGVEFNLQSNTMSGIVVDGLVVVGGQVNSIDSNAEISSVVNTPKIDLSKVGGVSTDSNTGTASNGTQRVVIASNDPNLSQLALNQTNGTQTTRVTDGTNTAAVVGPFVTPSGAEPALVVAISGNSIFYTYDNAYYDSAIKSVAASTTSVLLSAGAGASGSRGGGVAIHNNSTAILYVALADTASTTSYTVKMVADSYYETPFRYIGPVAGVWDSAVGFARITEVS